MKCTRPRCTFARPLAHPPHPSGPSSPPYLPTTPQSLPPLWGCIIVLLYGIVYTILTNPGLWSRFSLTHFTLLPSNLLMRRFAFLTRHCGANLPVRPCTIFVTVGSLRAADGPLEKISPRRTYIPNRRLCFCSLNLFSVFFSFFLSFFKISSGRKAKR